MAKSGSIVVSAGHASQTAENASVVEKVAPPRPTVATLGNVTKLSLAGLSVAGLILVDFANRKVGVATRNAGYYSTLSTKIIALTGDWFEFLPADATKTSSGWSVKKNGTLIGQTLAGTPPTGLGLLLTDALGFSAPSRSLESLVSAIEDALIEAGLDGVCVIDQVAEKVILGVCADLSAEWDQPTTNMFTTLVDEDAGTPFTVLADVTSCPGIADGSYRIAGGSSTGVITSVTAEVSTEDLGTVDDVITLFLRTSTDHASKKVAVVTQTVAASEVSGVGMFQS